MGNVLAPINLTANGTFTVDLHDAGISLGGLPIKGCSLDNLSGYTLTLSFPNGSSEILGPWTGKSYDLGSEPPFITATTNAVQVNQSVTATLNVTAIFLQDPNPPPYPISYNAGTNLGNAQGDINGAWPNLTVVGLQGHPVSTAVPVTGAFLFWNGTNWIESGVTGEPGFTFGNGSFPWWNGSGYYWTPGLSAGNKGLMLWWDGSIWNNVGNGLGAGNAGEIMLWSGSAWVIVSPILSNSSPLLTINNTSNGVTIAGNPGSVGWNGFSSSAGFFGTSWATFFALGPLTGTFMWVGTFLVRNTGGSACSGQVAFSGSNSAPSVNMTCAGGQFDNLAAGAETYVTVVATGTLTGQNFYVGGIATVAGIIEIVGGTGTSSIDISGFTSIQVA